MSRLGCSMRCFIVHCKGLFAPSESAGESEKDQIAIKKYQILSVKCKVDYSATIFGGSLESPKWLIGCFCLEILVWWWGPTKAFCRSVNVHGVVVLS